MQLRDQTPQLVPVRGGPVTREQLQTLLELPDTRCVRYKYCLSCIFVSFEFESPVYLTVSEERRLTLSFYYSLLTLLVGFWGIPWGPYLSCRAIWQNFDGGIDANAEVLSWLDEPPTSVETAAST